jgi:hypothetical protein
MQEDNKELERYLNEFRPRAVRPLELRPVAHMVWPRRLAAAAVVLLAAGAWLWYAGRGTKLEQETTKITTQKGSPVVDWKANTIVLTKMALEDPKRFEEQLDEESRRVLPDLRGQHSTLGVFAHD